MFEILDQTQCASTGLPFPRKREFQRGIKTLGNCSFFSFTSKNQFSCFPDIIETNSKLEALEADAPSCGISGLVTLPLRPTSFIG